MLGFDFYPQRNQRFFYRINLLTKLKASFFHQESKMSEWMNDSNVVSCFLKNEKIS